MYKYNTEIQLKLISRKSSAAHSISSSEGISPSSNSFTTKIISTCSSVGVVYGVIKCSATFGETTISCSSVQFSSTLFGSLIPKSYVLQCAGYVEALWSILLGSKPTGGKLDAYSRTTMITSACSSSIALCLNCSARWAEWSSNEAGNVTL